MSKTSKKGFFFTIDAFVAITIALVGIMLFLSYYFVPQPEAQTYYYSQDILKALSETKIYEFNDNDYPYIQALKQNNNITNNEQSLLQQITEFYYKGKEKGCAKCLEIATNFTQNITSGLVRTRYNFNITIDDESIFERNSSTVQITNKEQNSTILLTSKLIVNGMFNYTEFYGPYIVKVKAYQ